MVEAAQLLLKPSSIAVLREDFGLRRRPAVEAALLLLKPSSIAVLREDFGLRRRQAAPGFLARQSAGGSPVAPVAPRRREDMVIVARFVRAQILCRARRSDTFAFPCAAAGKA